MPSCSYYLSANNLAGQMSNYCYMKVSNLPVPDRFIEKTGNLLPIVNAEDFDENGVANINGFVFSQTEENTSDGTISNINLPNVNLMFDRNIQTAFSRTVNSACNYNVTIKMNKPIIIQNLIGIDDVSNNASKLLVSSDGIVYTSLGTSLNFSGGGLNNNCVYSQTVSSYKRKIPSTNDLCINYLRISMEAASKGNETVGMQMVQITNWLEGV